MISRHLTQLHGVRWMGACENMKYGEVLLEDYPLDISSCAFLCEPSIWIAFVAARRHWHTVSWRVSPELRAPTVYAYWLQKRAAGLKFARPQWVEINPHRRGYLGSIVPAVRVDYDMALAIEALEPARFATLSSGRHRLRTDSEIDMIGFFEEGANLNGWQRVALDRRQHLDFLGPRNVRLFKKPIQLRFRDRRPSPWSQALLLHGPKEPVLELERKRDLGTNDDDMTALVQSLEGYLARGRAAGRFDYQGLPESEPIVRLQVQDTILTPAQQRSATSDAEENGDVAPVANPPGRPSPAREFCLTMFLNGVREKRYDLSSPSWATLGRDILQQKRKVLGRAPPDDEATVSGQLSVFWRWLQGKRRADLAIAVSQAGDASLVQIYLAEKIAAGRTKRQAARNGKSNPINV